MVIYQQWSVVRLRGLRVTDWTQAASSLTFVSAQVLVSMLTVLLPVSQSLLS